MASEPKTKPTEVPVAGFIAAIDNPRQRSDAEVVNALLTEVSGEAPVMWGPSIVGYGSYAGPTGNWPIVGFSPRKAQLVLYVLGYPGQERLLARLGKHKIGSACLYINKLDDVDADVLRQIVVEAVAWTRKTHPAN